MSFEKDLKKAQKYEEMFATIYNKTTYFGFMKWNDEKYTADYTVEINDSTFQAEIKIDFTKYNNFFLEKYSNKNTKRIGGPRQAQKYGAKFFVYWFVSEKNAHQWECYIFKTDELVRWLDENEKKYQIKEVKNKTHTTTGYAIPIQHLSSLEFFKKEK